MEKVPTDDDDRPKKEIKITGATVFVNPYKEEEEAERKAAEEARLKVNFLLQGALNSPQNTSKPWRIETLPCFRQGDTNYYDITLVLSLLSISIVLSLLDFFLSHTVPANINHY